ncbi:4'-phosphopantetheinyl transferase [Trametes sanguinea]|nr:4'-phosphopantetheinyl transferase [Trametes sanguinea]
MGILGIGVDIVHMPRIVRLMDRRSPARFAQRILSTKELCVWHAIPLAEETRRTRYLAVRWAVKEAAYKAVYPAARPTWKDFTFHSLSSDPLRKPTLEYHSRSPNTPWSFHVSVSHDGDYVFATVLVETS